MYSVKYMTEKGWQYLPEEMTSVEADLEAAFLSQYYRYVSIVQVETTTKETLVREIN